MPTRPLRPLPPARARRPLATAALALAGLLVLAVAAAALALVLAVDTAPRVVQSTLVSPADIDRAVQMARLHDPRQAPPGLLRWVPLAERDVDLLVDHGARRWLGAATRVRLLAGRATVEASLALPFGRWLNVDAGLVQQAAGLPAFDRLRIGRLPLPPVLALPLLRALAARRGVQADALLEAGWIERVALQPGRMLVLYRITPDTVNRLRSALVGSDEQDRLQAYTERLAALAQAVPGNAVSMAQLLPPLFALAAERSAAGGDAVAENRAALLTLAFYANQRPLSQMVPAARGWPPPRQLAVTLQQRGDFALHFVISAVIAAQSGTPLADAVGVWKEIVDARRGGSGFSFNDLAADRAGTRFGERAVRDAAALQARVAGGVVEADVMPATDDLPEFLSAEQLAARYGGPEGAGTKRLMDAIEARVDALPVLR